MTRFVNLYLLITGGLGALALLMPSLVLLGLFLGILPGMILGAMPTAFLWGVGFAVPWFAMRPLLGDYGAILPAALIAAAIFWFAPQPSAARSKERLAQSIRLEMLPPEPIRLAGHVLLDVAMLKVENTEAVTLAKGASRPYECDALCAALLATPGVASVTVNAHGTTGEAGPLTSHARTFRIVPKAECGGPTVRPRNADGLNVDRPKGPDGFQDRIGTLQAEWDLRLSTRDCIIAEAPRSDHDFVIRRDSYRAFADKSRGRSWLPGSRDVSVERLEVRDGKGRVLLSKSLAATMALARPLHIMPQGGIENFRFEWGRKRLSNNERAYQLNSDQLLADHSNLRTEVDRAAILKATRERLVEALADPAIPATDPAFKLVGPWLRSLATPPVSDDDLELLAKLIRDGRTTEFEGIWGAIEAAGERGRVLRSPMVERIASLDASTDGRVKSLGRALDRLPAGTFAEPTETELAILSDPARRALAPGLIARQADRGPAAVPMLVDMLEFHLGEIARKFGQRGSDSSADMIVADRVRMALCALGPDGSAALPAIERLAAKGLDRRFAEDREWHLMLARIGKPVAEIAKPANLSGSEAQFHRNLQHRLDRFRPDSDCRPQWS